MTVNMDLESVFIHQSVAAADPVCLLQVERKAVQLAGRIVEEAATELWPECSVGLFGSQMSSMALPGSDVDITILGVPDLPQTEAAGVSKCAINLAASLLMPGSLQGLAADV
jgi:predicted nucleotidyltransferase